MAKSHHDKIAVISGGGGRHRAGVCAKGLAQDGAHIVIADVAPGEVYGEDCGASCPPRACLQMRRVLGGLGQGALLKRSSQQTLRPLRHPHKLRRQSLLNKPFDEITFADWRRVQAINLDSVFLCSAAFAPSIETAPMGTHRQHVIEHTRLSGEWVRTLHGEQGQHRRYHVEGGQPEALGPYSITVNAISPGLTRSPGTLARAPRPAVHEHGGRIPRAATMQVIKRAEVPEDLVGAVSFLTSDDAA